MKKYYYTYTDSQGNFRGIEANSKYEALYTASCLCGEIIPSASMRKSGKMEAIIKLWRDTNFNETRRQSQRLNPAPATLINARHRVNANA